jgi:hypothetical protein
LLEWLPLRTQITTNVGEDVGKRTKLARFRMPKVACFLSSVEYRPKMNTAILRKIGHSKGRSHMREGV